MMNIKKLKEGFWRIGLIAMVGGAVLGTNVAVGKDVFDLNVPKLISVATTSAPSTVYVPITDDVGTNCAGYVDVWYRSFYCPAIKAMIRRGIFYDTGGNSGLLLSPTGKESRIGAVKTMVALNNLYADVSAVEHDKLDLGFSDVDNSVWYAYYIKVIMDRGIVKGYADHTFKPYNFITRAEYLAILLRSANVDVSGCSKSSFVDVPENAWFANYVCYAKEHGIIELDNENKFYPSAEMTLQETAYYMFKAQESGLF